MYNFYDDYKDPVSEIEQEQIHMKRQIRSSVFETN